MSEFYILPHFSVLQSNYRFSVPSAANIDSIHVGGT